MKSTFLYGAQIRANGIRQHYLRYGGSGPTVIIVPGITSPAVTWGFVAERFGQVFDTYVLDVRGRGLSESSDTLDYGLNACAADVAAFASALDLDDFGLVGHSMGARIGLRMESNHETSISCLALVDPPVSGPGRRRYPSSLPWYVDSIKLAKQGITIEQMRAFCPTWSDDQLRLRAQWLHTCDERAVITTFDSFHQDDIHENLSRVRVPCLLVRAGRGGVIEEADKAEMRKLLPALQVADVENAGHMIPWDDEEGFYRAFGGFLGKAIPAAH
jgi:N-formylmaleamate deformylase